MPKKYLLPLALALSFCAFSEEPPVTHDDKNPKFTNALAKETSPYLLQHAHNPVNWYPWGDEAFAKAKKENKPVFLSVGYSSCHWCHVMEHESFENESVAKILNDNFIAIKVDREERPDIDEIYMACVQLVSGRGGWPMSVFLTPEGKPFYGGTYFPPEDFGQRIGFKSLLNRVHEAWLNQHDDIVKDSERMSDAVREQLANRKIDAQTTLDKDFFAATLEDLHESFDPQRGGFSRAPKFPPNNGLPYLLYMKQHGYARDPKALDEMITLTLDQMALGGIHDHLAGGFHRYSTDERWFLPHFEKMLYDNALLAPSYAQAAIVYNNPNYERVARGICDWVLREMSSPDGGFYSTLDADSEGEEGKFYVWSTDEIKALLGKDGDTFCKIFNASDDGNFHEEATGKRMHHNILFLSKPLAEHAKNLKLSEDELRAKVDGWKKTLLVARVKRVWPSLDDKILTAWNGLMIAGLAKTSVLLKEPRYKDAALKAAEFMLKNQRTPGGRWLATHRKGQSKLPAYLDDHAFMALAFAELFEATQDERWKKEAVALIDLMDKHFADEKGGGYFFIADDHEKLLARTKDATDKAIPSGNGWAAQALVELWLITGDERYHAKAKALLAEFHGLMERIPRATESLLLAGATFHDAEVAKGAVAKTEIKPEPSATRGAVKVELFAGASAFQRGASTPVAVKFSIAQGNHIQAHTPDDPLLKATYFALFNKDLGELKDERYPDPVELTLPDQKLKVYSGEVIGKAALNVPATAPLGKSLLKVEVHFQACDDQQCADPQKVLLSIPIEIVDDNADLKATNEEIFKGK
ncbi:MAG TPA: thioredoxin domain-containing protein [Planctomycetota bacterium]|nr:thioredoxin domain-containing protein [Planctomycetota bacterium]